ncbi:flavocytochrome c [Treponema socranskii subsp. socranskii VPI DR56BR1116 = ATCC 35536]|uniref:Flavocytochrome c n=1 Tax=Treponema socranskii subsp. socranskii VPI DR56BR1116 = ATCC 35536 TaxID=1125725 RepID=U1GYQ1_TRESO|nr:FAD-dependent oxidoreductase [Treponema socranskii]ERF61654.1 flavocytochrome c [Treponema socranskii subsp. socranskii VPI DR56BR1116 = ATCC 35536]ERK02710.1 flavocytochrome c [Treponema socranskii subsp. socranskii VPI DR56BR1116 = ATCC 35536]
MKKSVKVLTALLTAVSLFACKSGKVPEKKASFKPGTYSGQAQGFHGLIKLNVTVDERSIKKIVITEQNETEGIGSNAVEQLPGKIVKAQSLAVDTIAGCTISSKAILAAVETALASSGADTAALKKVQKTEARTVATKELNTQVLVVGAGGAGMTAALRAAQKGLKVLVVEKMAYVGGATAMSSSSTFAQGTRTQKEKDSPEAAKEDLLKVGNNKNDDIPVTLLATYSGEAVDWLDDSGVDYADDTGRASAEYRVGRARMHISRSGAGLIKNLYDVLRAQGVEVKLNTPAYKLITDNGKVTGAWAHGEDADYKINADAVILATGGYCYDNRYISKELKKLPNSGSVANTGDGLTMVEPLGAKLINMEYVAVAGHGIRKGNSSQHTKPQCLTAYRTTGTILVNMAGKRIVNETGTDAKLVDAMAKAGRVFMLMDKAAFDVYTSSAIERKYFSEADKEQWLKENGTGITVFAHGDSLKEVAERVGMDAAGLEKTFEAYKSYAAKGEDPNFGRKATIALSDKGPYYLVEQCLRYSTTLGGVQINEKLQVLKKDGTAIEGLYAAGEFVGGVFGERFPPSSGVGWAMTSGKLVGESVAEALK